MIVIPLGIICEVLKSSIPYSKEPLNGVDMGVILSLTNSNITLNLRLANAPENSRKLCKPETQSRIYVTF